MEGRRPPRRPVTHTESFAGEETLRSKDRTLSSLTIGDLALKSRHLAKEDRRSGTNSNEV